jgi:hypothetical protein
MALLPDREVTTAEGSRFHVGIGGEPTDIFVTESPTAMPTLLLANGRDVHWATFRRGLASVVKELVQNPDVQALADPKLERLVQALDD